MVTFSEINGAVNLTSAVTAAAGRRSDSMMELVSLAATGNPRAEALGLVQRQDAASVFACGSCCHATGTWGCRAAGGNSALPAMNSLLAAVANN